MDDLRVVWDWLQGYVPLMWKSLTAGLTSPVTMGIFMSEAIIIILIVLFFLGISRLFRRRKRRKFNRYRGENMSPVKRGEDLKKMVEDIITDGLFEAEFSGKITREEANYWFKRLAEGSHLHGLRSSKFRKLKDEIKDRLAAKKDPVPLPDGEVVKSEKKKKLFTGGLFGKKAA